MKAVNTLNIMTFICMITIYRYGCVGDYIVCVRKLYHILANIYEYLIKYEYKMLHVKFILLIFIIFILFYFIYIYIILVI